MAYDWALKTVFNRGVPGRVPAGTNGTSRPFCPGAGTSRQMPKLAGTNWTNGTKKVLCSIGATNYNIEIILFFSSTFMFFVRFGFNQLLFFLGHRSKKSQGHWDFRER